MRGKRTKKEKKNEIEQIWCEQCKKKRNCCGEIKSFVTKRVSSLRLLLFCGSAAAVADEMLGMHLVAKAVAVPTASIGAHAREIERKRGRGGEGVRGKSTKNNTINTDAVYLF